MCTNLAVIRSSTALVDSHDAFLHGLGPSRTVGQRQLDLRFKGGRECEFVRIARGATTIMSSNVTNPVIDLSPTI
jgi:hypothetical protein